MSLPLEANSEAVVAVLRMLNGPLCGCEFKLQSGATLVIAGAENALLSGQNVPQLPENAIVVPLSGGINFEILIDVDGRDGFRLRHLSSPVTETEHVWKEICSVGTLSFAIRRKTDAWSPVDHSSEAPQSRSPTRKTWWRRTLIAALALIFLLGSGLVSWLALNDSKRVAEVTAVIAGSNDHYQIIRGRDGLVYIFAESERGVSWATQALVREGMDAKAKVLSLHAEEDRIARLLQENYPSVLYHRIRLGNPSRPILIFSKERSGLSGPAKQLLTASLMQWMPYADATDMTNWSDDMVEHQAQSGLDRLGVSYTRSDNGNSVTFDVQHSLSDGERAGLQDFVRRFYQDFGTQYVYFSIELRDDVFKGKSFMYGSRGYVKLSPNHWFFSTNF